MYMQARTRCCFLLMNNMCMFTLVYMYTCIHICIHINICVCICKHRLAAAPSY